MLAGVAGHGSIIPQTRAAVVDRGGEDRGQGRMEPGGTIETDPASRRVDPGPPQCFIGVDIADPSDHALGKKSGFNWATLRSEQAMELFRSEVGIEWFGAHRGQRREAVVVASRHDGDAAKSAHIVELKDAAITELPPSPTPAISAQRVGFVLGDVSKPEVSGHAQVDDEFSIVVGGDEQILAAAPDFLEASPDHVARLRELGRWMACRCHHRCAWKRNSQLTSNGFDLRQFRHVAMVWVHLDWFGDRRIMP